jgi:hypothetical protein
VNMCKSVCSVCVQGVGICGYMYGCVSEHVCMWQRVWQSVYMWHVLGAYWTTELLPLLHFFLSFKSVGACMCLSGYTYLYVPECEC